jgi:hypothetical protein
MDLEAEEFTGIVAAMRLRGGARAWDDRRSMGRIPMQKCMAIIPFKTGATGETINVWVRDISAGGIGLVYAHRMEAGDEFVIRLPRVDGSELAMLCTVTHCASLAPELFTIGASFNAIAPADAIPKDQPPPAAT